MVATHTPGPWRLSGPDDFGDYAIQPPNEPLAIAAVVNGEMRRMGGKSDEHVANARLIAAAPDLLRIVEVFLGHDDRFQVAVCGNPLAADKMLADARDVYARATGAA